MADSNPVSLEEYEARQTEIKARIMEIDAEFQGQAFPDEPKAEWNALSAERKRNTKVIEELRARRAHIASLSEDPSNTEPGAHFNVPKPGARGNDIYDLSTVRSSVSDPSQAANEMRDRAMRSVDTATFPNEDADQAKCKEHVERLLGRHATKDGGALSYRLLATGSPVYKRAFSKTLAGLPLSRDEQRALSLTAASGGYAVPYTLDPTILPTSNGAVNPLRAISRVETITGSEWRGVTSAGVTAQYRAEGAEMTDNSPTLVQPTATVERCDALVPYSMEIGGDWDGLLSEVASAIQQAKDEVEATKFTVGAGHGSTEPEGIITGATGTVAAGTAAFAIAHLYALQDALAPRYEPNARFMAHNAQYNRVRQFDTDGGADLWMQLGDSSDGKGLLGYPTHKNSAMDSVLTAGSEIMVFGDFRYFLIVDRLGLNIELVPHLFGASGFPVGKRAVAAIWRNTSDVLAAGAFKVLKTT